MIKINYLSACFIFTQFLQQTYDAQQRKTIDAGSLRSHADPLGADLR